MCEYEIWEELSYVASREASDGLKTLAEEEGCCVVNWQPRRTRTAAGRRAAFITKAQPPQDRTMKPSDPKKQPSQEKTTKPVDPKTQPPKEKTTKADDAKAKQTPKSEPAKPALSTKPKDTATVTSKASTGKPPSKQDLKPGSGKEKTESKVSSGAAGKVAAAAGTVVAAAAAGAAAAGSVKPKAEVKEVKKAVGADKVSAAAAAPAKSTADDALDELVGSLGARENVPESPKFTGPEIKDDPASSEHLDKLGEKESTIPPEYRNLLDGKGEKPAIPAEKPRPSLGDDDLVGAFSADFVSCSAPPEEKKPKLDERIAIKPTSAGAVSSESSKEVVPGDALDLLMGTLEGPPSNVPESPVFTGPEVKENITATRLEGLGIRESTIPPKYRNLLDGKDHGEDIQPTAPSVETKPLTDSELADEFSKDFGFPTTPVVPTSTKPTESKKDKAGSPSKVIASSASSTQAAAAAPPSKVDSALDDLMNTLDGPEFSAPESPAYTGPEVTETNTSSYVEALGKHEGTIPPKYRNLLDGKEDGKVVPPSPEEKPLGDDELLDAFDKDFGCQESFTDKKTPPVKPQDPSEKAKADTDVVISASCSSAVQAAPAPSKGPVQKTSAPKADPFDALSGTLGVKQVQGDKDKKPAADSVKEKTEKDKKGKLGEDEKTIPPEYRLQEVKDKDGKPILPKPADKPKEMSEEDLLDALTEGFDASPSTTAKTSPLQCSAKETKSTPGSEVVSCSKASAVKAGAPQPEKADAQIPDDALDLLSGSLGSRTADPDENKPLVDHVKEKATSQHVERLGDRDSTIPPDYRNLLDGKDEKGQPIPAPTKEDVKRETSIDDDAAIDALSSGFGACATKSTENTQQTSKDQNEKCSSGTAVSHPPGKTSDPAKDKNEKCSSGTAVSHPPGKTSDPAKEKAEKSSTSATVSQSSGKPSAPLTSKNETSPAKPGGQKTCKS